MDLRVHHVCIQTEKYEESLDFYTRILGFKIIKETKNFHKREYNTWLSLGDFMIEIQTKKEGDILKPWSSKAEGIVHICFMANDVKTESEPTGLHLFVGKTDDNKDVYVEESGLYQNFLITGTIGSGKTSSAMYPFTEQLLRYNSENINDKIGMLILDVKGNYYNQILEYAKLYNLEDDLVVIGFRCFLKQGVTS